ncbi:MAG: AEC family transporter [Eubacterium sp.]|nr:AEC family transporter [Candidatus Colimonas fimequi]
MATTQIIMSLIKLFLMIIPGYLLGRYNVMDETQSKGISTIIVNVTWPCLIVISLQREFSAQLCINMGILAAVMVSAVVIAFVIARILCKGMKLDKAKTYLVTFMLIFGNTGFMGIPVCTVLYGSEGTFYAALIDAVQDIFIFTVGILLIEKSTGKHIGISIKHFLTPGFASVIIGVGLFVARITLPDIVATPMETMGSATGPLAMMVVGFQLGKLNLKDLISDKRLYVMSFVRLLIMPLIFLGVVMLVFPEMNLLAKVIIVEMATPVAACTTIYSQQYDGDVAFATKGVMLSTVLSIVTLSAFAVLVEFL